MLRLLLPLCALILSASLLSASPVTVNVGIPGDTLVAPYNNNNAGWFMEFTAGPSGLVIDSISVTLGGGLVINTGTCVLSLGCGFNSAIVSGANIGTPGFTSTSPSTIADGATTFALNFSGFNPGERFRFLLDIDDTTPSFDSTVDANELFSNNNTVTYAIQFSGPGYTTTTLTGALSFVENLDISPLPIDIVAVNYARATITGDIPLDADVPEPATSLLMAAAILTLGLKRLRP